MPGVGGGCFNKIAGLWDVVTTMAPNPFINSVNRVMAEKIPAFPSSP